MNRAILISEQNFKRKSLSGEIQAIYLDIIAQQRVYNELYDTKTGSGKNWEAQVEWTNKILSLLDTVAEFDKIKITKAITE
jgi:hypothetical protein